MENEFSFGAVKNFDEHIERSIPRYLELKNIVSDLAKYFIDDGENVYDLGCSTGKLLYDLLEKHGDNYSFIGIENEFNFTKDHIQNKNIKFYPADLSKFTDYSNTSFITSIFTLQFIKENKRQEILKEVYNGLNDGGAFIMAEKVYSADSKINDIMTFLYYDFKKKSFSSDEIFDKENSLRKIMKPLSHDDNINMLKKAGFRKIDTFWRAYNFIGYIAIK